MREAHISRILPCYLGVQIENIPTSGEGSLPRLMSRIFRKWTEHKIALVDSAELKNDDDLFTNHFLILLLIFIEQIKS